MTKEEIVQKLTSILIRKRKVGHTWADLVTGVQTLSEEEKQSLVDAVYGGDKETLLKLMRLALVEKQQADAQAYVEGLLVDDQLSLLELEVFL